MGLSGPKGAPKVGPKRSPPKGAPKANPSFFLAAATVNPRYSTTRREQ